MNRKWLVYAFKAIAFCLFSFVQASQSPSLDSDSGASSDGISSIESGLEQELLLADAVVAEEQMAALRGQTLLILEKLENAAALLQSDPSDEAVRDTIGKLVRKFNTIKAEAKKIDFDLGQDAKVIASTLGNLPKKPKNIKMEQPVSVLVESQTMSVTPLPTLALKFNTFGDQAQLPHEGQPFKKHVAGLLTYFPYQVSPARGIILSSNGSLKKEWDIVGKSGNENHLMKKMFNSLDGQVVKTHLGSNPVMGLSPEIIGQLVRIISTDAALLLQLDDPFFNSWHESYMSTLMPENQRFLKDNKKFKDKARIFLKALAHHVVTENGKQEAIDLLLSYLVMETEDRGVVAAGYAKGLGIEYVPVYFTDQDYEEAKKNVLDDRLTEETIKPYLEQLIFLTGLQVGLRKYITCTTGYVTYQGNTFPMCKEATLRRLVSVILYNPETGRLDLQMLPAAAQKTVSQELKQFVAKYGDRAASDEEVMQAFLDLIENKLGRGIVYEHETYEIMGEIDSGIAVLRMLFGIKDELKGSDSEQFEQLLHLLFDNGKRSFKLDDDDDDGAFERENNLDQKSEWKCIISSGEAHADDDDDADAIKMLIDWSGGHGSLDVTLHDDVQAAASTHSLYVGGRVLDVFLLGSSDTPLPRMLHYLVGESILSAKEDFVRFFTEYSSQFGKKIPEIFSDIEDDWEFFFENCSQQVCANVVQAAIAMGLDKDANKEGILREAFRPGMKNRDFDLISTICDYGLNPPPYFFMDICASDFSEDQKKELIKKLFEGGLFRDDIAHIFYFLDAQSLRLLPEGQFGIDRADSKGNTLIMLAVSDNEKGAWDKFNLLLEVGAKLDAKNVDGETIGDLFLKNITSMDERLKQPITPEEYHSWDGLKYTFDRVLSYRYSIDRIPDDKMDPVEKERLKNAYQKCAQDYEEFKKKNSALMAGVSDINAAADSKRNTALMLAVSFYDRDTFKLLVEAGAQLDVTNNEGQTVYDILLQNIKDMEKVFTTSPTKEEFGKWGFFNGREGILYSHHFESSLQEKLATLEYFASVMKDKASSDQTLDSYRKSIIVTACKTFLLDCEKFKKKHPELIFYT